DHRVGGGEVGRERFSGGHRAMESYPPPCARPKSSACRRRPPGLLRHAPVDAFEQIAELGRRDRDRAVGRRRPDEAAALELLREQAGALAAVPQNLEPIAAAAAEDEQAPIVRITLQRPLHHQRQARKALPHVGVASRQPLPHAARNRNPRDPSASSTRRSASPSTSRSTRTRRPPPSSISMMPLLRRLRPGDADGTAASTAGGMAAAGTISTGTNCDEPVSTRSHSSLRHRKSWLT